MSDHAFAGQFFVVGCPRSGTTLLQAMLNRHPGVAVPPETKLFVDFDRADISTRRDCLRRIEKDCRVEFDNLESMALSFKASDLLAELRTRYLQRRNRSRIRMFGEKTPEHTSRISRIREVFPHSPIIATVRDGVAVADSLTRVPWLRCNHAAGAVIWNYYTGFITRAVDQGLPGVYVVRYEELVESPKAILADLFRLLRVAGGHEADCLRPNPELDNGLFPPRETAWKQRAREMLHRPTNVALPTSAQRTIEAISGPMLRRWGYSTNCGLSTFQLTHGRLQGWFSSLTTVACLPKGTVWREVKLLPKQWIDSSRATRTVLSPQPFVGADSQHAAANSPHFPSEHSTSQFPQRHWLCPLTTEISSVDE